MNIPPRPTLPRVAIYSGIGAALLLTAIWAAYQFWSPEKAATIGMFLLVLVIAVVLILVLIWGIWKFTWWLRARRARQQESFDTGSRIRGTPEEQSELDALGEQLQSAARTLRESKLARGKSAEEALYTLPWILLLGPAESGKTAVLRECGVDFPYTTADSRRSARGMAAGCDYWFSRGAVVMDLAGRIGAAEEGSRVFEGYLDQLKRVRKARPIDGVVVTVSIREILDMPPEHTERLANQLRQRFDTMIRRLGVRFPIYLLFTKCDQLEGFKEFFGNLRSRDRAQVWGASISKSQRKRHSADQIFEQEFDQLVRALDSHRLQLLAGENDSYKLAQIFTFPTRFSATRERLSRFVGTLLQPTPYSERPMFRGFYLASAAGAPEEMAPPQATGVPKAWDPAVRRYSDVEQPARVTKNFFLENLFPGVIFADRPQATASVDTRLRRRTVHDVALAATVLICALCLGFMTFSFFRNRGLIEETRNAGLVLADSGWTPKSTVGMQAMENLQDKLTELARYRNQGPPLRIRWGLYSGDEIYDAGLRLYYRRLKETFVNPVADQLRQRLAAMAAQGQSVTYYDLYNILKAYMWMTVQPADPAPEEAFLKENLEPFWRKYSPNELEGLALALSQLHFYTQQMAKRAPELLTVRDDQVVSLARQALRRYSFLERRYASLKSEGNSKFKAFNLDQATGGRTEYFSATAEVPGIFTEAGWSTFFREAISKASKSVLQDDWVLGPAGPGSSLGAITDVAYEAKLREWYFGEYAEAWFKFLDGLSLRSMNDLPDAVAALDVLSKQEYSLARLLTSVGQNTLLLKEPRPAAGTPGADAAAQAQKLNRTDYVDTIYDKFAPLHEVVFSVDGKTPSILAQYIDTLGKLRGQLQMLLDAGGQWDQVRGYVARVSTSLAGTEFHDGYRLAQRVRQLCASSRYTNPVVQLVEQPMGQSWNALLADLGNQMNGRWRNQIAELYRREVEGMFPFNPTAQMDLPLTTLSKYFRPNEGILWTFYEKEVRPFLPSTQGSMAQGILASRIAFSSEFLEFMKRAETVRDSFFGYGGAEPRVEFDMTPEGTPEVVESILEIDGQPALRYGNWLPAPQNFTWPGKPGPPQARVSIAITGSAERPSIPAISGDWAFFRLLQKGQVMPQSVTSYLVEFTPPSSDARKLKVRYRLRARSAANPFDPGFFRGIRCPDQILAPRTLGGITLR